MARKKKKKGSSRARGRRPANEMFWETARGVEEEVYNGPPVNVIYTTSP